MTHPRTMTSDNLHGLEVVDSDGEKVGKVNGIYTDAENDQPEWAAVKTGFFGSHEALIPLATASVVDGKLSVPFTKDMIKDAPHTDPDAELSQAAEAELFTYYKVPYGGDTVTALTDAPAAANTGAGVQDTGVQDTSGSNTDDAMTRSEERLRVGTTTEVSGKARLRKYIVTENATQTVPVSHEEVTVTREPITEANRGAAMTGGDLTEEEAEVTLHEQRAVASKETVPVERVKLGTETVAGEETVNETLRQEVIEADGDVKR